MTGPAWSGGPVPAYCDTFWGSHGCDLPPGHDGPHQCGLRDICSRAEGNAGGVGAVTFWYGSTWGNPTDWYLFSTTYEPDRNGAP